MCADTLRTVQKQIHFFDAVLVFGEIDLLYTLVAILHKAVTSKVSENLEYLKLYLN